MKKEKIEYFGLLDEKYVEEASPENAHRLRNMRKKRFKRIVALAACFCLIIGLSASLFNNLYRPQIPVYENALYSAEYIGSFFGGIGSYGGTSAYEEVFAPSANHLAATLAPIQEAEYFSIYRQTTKPTNKTEFLNFAEPIISRLGEEAGIYISDYEVMETEKEIFLAKIKQDGSGEEISASISQNEISNSVKLLLKSKNGAVSLGDSNAKISISADDAEILAEISGLKEALFKIFGVRFENVRLVRGESFVSLFLCNENEELFEHCRRPLSAHVEIHFSYGENSEIDFAIIDYRTMRTKTYVYTEAKSIPLSDAKKLLRKGYVFGGHTCPVCMAKQEKVDFSVYDFAGFAYLENFDREKGIFEYIPFYKFYKKIGESEKGGVIYALTYVPAIEVSGYEEYFASLAKLHENE